MRQKIQICLMILILLALIADGTSIALFTDDVKAEINRFFAGRVKIEIVGEPEVQEALKEQVDRYITWTIKNESTDDVYLRVKPIAYIDLEELNIKGNIDLQAADNGWEKGDDEYYYYPNPLKPEKTLNFTLRVTFNVWESIERFPVNIEVEAIQASNDAINQMWKQNPFKKGF